MELAKVVIQIQEPDALEVLQPHWEESVATLSEEVPPFLDPAEFTVSREYCGFGPEVDPLLEAAARRIMDDPALRRLAWHCSRLLWEHEDYSGMGQWPSLECALGERSGVFYLLVAMGMVPRVRAVHEAMGVPNEVTRETCTWVATSAIN